jgi:signal-transduction protein with cAMP-binding, CBS, and nucleotidyltransferase domain
MGPGKMAAEYSHSHGSKVSEVMSTDVQSVGEQTPLEDIVALMERKRIKRVPVVCGGELVGIITRSNLVRAMVSLARTAPPVGKDDAAIRNRLLKEMQKETWAPVAMVDVQVKDGIVELWGSIMDERQREALKVAAENIPGVKGVKDYLSWIEPMSGMVIENKNAASAR